MAGHPEDQLIRKLSGCYELFPVSPETPAELDMGCGTGSFTAALASAFPQRQIFAADVMIGRLRKVVKRKEKAHLDNLQVLRVEARIFIGLMLPDASLDRIHLLCPDPWPKLRHRGHRLLCCDFTTQLHRVLKSDGIFHFSSDDEAYCEAVDRVMKVSGLFADAPEGIADIAALRSDFENRWLSQGKAVHHRAWRKLPLPEITIGH